MLALSIRQPWATLIVKGAPMMKSIDNGDGSSRIEFAGVIIKDIENRDWPTGVRGKIYIHAPKRADDYTSTMRWLGEHIGVAPFACMLLSSDKYSPKGVILGEVDIVDCVTESKSPWFVGKYGFTLSRPILYNIPIPYKGKLGFFEVDENVIQDWRNKEGT